VLFGWLAVRAFRRHRARTGELPEIVPLADIEVLREHEHQQT
jgi:hypothetical protein